MTNRYEPDEIDPTLMADEEEWEDVGSDERHDVVDYRILSKSFKKG